MLKNFIVTICFVFVTNVVVFAYDSEEIIYMNVYEKINPSIVSIDAELPIGVSSGSGCIIDKNGLILTSAHVVDKSSKIDVTLYNGHVYKANIIYSSKKDIALIKIVSKEPLSIITLGDSEKLKVGQKVLAIGNPFGFNLGYGFSDRSSASENAIFYRGKLHKLEEVSFVIPADDKGKYNYTGPWTITSSDGRFEAVFMPIIDRMGLIDLKLFVSEQHQVFGRLTGTAILDDGRVIKMREIPAAFERVHNRY